MLVNRREKHPQCYPQSNLQLLFIPIPFPLGVLGRLEKVFRRFLWEGTEETKKIHWLKWVRITLPVEGGLGCKRLLGMSEAVMAKWLWRYGTEKDHLLRKLIAEKYEEGNKCWRPKKVNGSYGISLSKGITKKWENFESGILLILWSRISVSF